MSIEVIPAGRVKLVNPLQPENAYSPIEVIPAGRVKLRLMITHSQNVAD